MSAFWTEEVQRHVLHVEGAAAAVGGADCTLSMPNLRLCLYRQTARRVQYTGNEDYLHGNFFLMMQRRSLGRLILPDVPGVTVKGKKRDS